MGRIPDHWSFMGTGGVLFKWWQHSRSAQTMSPAMNPLPPETASVLLLKNNMEELDWYFQDIFDQFGNMYCFLDDINRLLNECPLEFLLFETQQLISFLRCHWNVPHSSLRATILCSLPHCLFVWNFCPSCAGKPTDFPCSISLMRTTHLFSPLPTLLDHMLYYFFSGTNSSRVMRQSGPHFCRVCYPHHR